MTFPVFASGDVLTAADMNAVGWWLVKTQTVGSGVSTVQVTSAFSSNYDNYKIVLAGGVASAGCDLKLTLGAAATNYYSGVIYHAYATAGPANAQALGANNTTSFPYAGSGSTTNAFMSVELYNPFLAKITGMTAPLSNPNTTGSVAYSSGFHNSATSYSDFTITTSTGTLTGGTIRVYGFRN